MHAHNFRRERTDASVGESLTVLHDLSEKHIKISAQTFRQESYNEGVGEQSKDHDENRTQLVALARASRRLLFGCAPLTPGKLITAGGVYGCLYFVGTCIDLAVTHGTTAA